MVIKLWVINKMNQNEIRPIRERAKPHVKLAGEDENAFSILGRVRSAMREVGWTKAEMGEAMDEMMSGDYDHLLVTVCELCEVD